MQAVVRIGPSQFLVSPGQKFVADRSQIDQVLLVVDEDKVLVGRPAVEGVKIEVEDLGEVRGDKIRVFKFTAKSRRRRQVGFRSHLRQLHIKDIKLSKKATS